MEDLLVNITEIENCPACMEVIGKMLDKDCTECGPPNRLEDIQMCHLGLDVVCLFPSMQEMNTGLIIRKRVMKSSLEMPSFDIKQGGRYIIINQHLTGPLGKLRRVLPHRRNNRG